MSFRETIETNKERTSIKSNNFWFTTLICPTSTYYEMNLLMVITIYKGGVIYQ